MAGSVSYVVANLVSWQPQRHYDLWHDRAVFHFLVDAADRQHYVDTSALAVKPGGVVVLGTFADDGPRQCSGLPTQCYDVSSLAEQFGTAFDLVHSARLRVIATPGHTYTHLSYALESAGEPIGVFSGGSLLFGSTGRPDLLGPEHTDALVHHQFASARRLAAELPDQAQLLPTHGFSAASARRQIPRDLLHDRHERRTKGALTQAENDYVANLLAVWMPGRRTTHRWARPTPQDRARPT